MGYGVVVDEVPIVLPLKLDGDANRNQGVSGGSVLDLGLQSLNQNARANLGAVETRKVAKSKPPVERNPVVSDSGADGVLFPNLPKKEPRVKAVAGHVREALNVGSLLDSIEKDLCSIEVPKGGGKSKSGVKVSSDKSTKGTPVGLPKRVVRNEENTTSFEGETLSPDHRLSIAVSQDNLPAILRESRVSVVPVDIDCTLLSKLGAVCPWLLNSLRFERGLAVFSDNGEDLVLCALGIEAQFAASQSVPELKLAQGYVLCERKSYLQGDTFVRFLIVV